MPQISLVCEILLDSKLVLAEVKASAIYSKELVFFISFVQSSPFVGLNQFIYFGFGLKAIHETIKLFIFVLFFGGPFIFIYLKLVFE